MKRSLSLALALCMVLTLLPFGAAAATVASGYCGENLTWTLSAKGVLTISGTGPIDDSEDWLTTPWYNVCESVKSVVIGSGVTRIGNNAFRGTSITSASIPGTVKEIGDQAFQGCSSLKELKLPSGVKTIGTGAFRYCDGFRSFTIPGSVRTIGEEAFYRCDNLQTVMIENGVTTIGSGAFSCCESLKSVSVPDSVKTIGSEAFYWSKALESVRVPEGVTAIEDGTFEKCFRLKHLDLPSSIRSIGYEAFFECGIEEIRIPEGVTAIESSAFHGCYYLEYVTIPTSLKSFGNDVFRYCDVKDVYYAGTEEQWNQIEKVSDNEELKKATMHFEDARGPVAFRDIRKGAYYYDAVIWAGSHEPQITAGTTAVTFSPDATCTRGQVVTFLWRANGCPEPTSDGNPFKDVKSSAYYYKAVLWAVEKGVTAGTSKTTFSPDAPCTRAHVVTFLWRANGQPAAGGSNPFSDVKSSAYYYHAVLWAVAQKITNGVDARHFAPDNPCTRGQIVTFLYRDQT